MHHAPVDRYTLLVYLPLCVGRGSREGGSAKGSEKGLGVVLGVSLCDCFQVFANLVTMTLVWNHRNQRV